MDRKLIGGAVIKVSVLRKALDDKATHPGLIFKIPSPKTQSGVALELYEAVIGPHGITEGNRIKCKLKSCSIEKSDDKSNLKAYQFEHCGQFSLFDTDEPFIAYFNRSQIEMLLSFGTFSKAYIASFMPVSSNPMVDPGKLIPNFSLEMQPYDLSQVKQIKSKSKTKSTVTTYGLPGTIRAAGCPRTWTDF